MRGYFGIGAFHPKHEQNIGTLFRSAVAFGASFVFTVGRRYRKQASDTGNAMGVVPLYHFKDLDDLKKHLPVGCRIVGVELSERAVPLDRYCHPACCVYLAGAEDHGLTPAALSFCHEVVVVPGATCCLNVASAGTVVMYDRFVKGTSKRPLPSAD